MTILLWNLLLAILHFKDLASKCFLVKHNHIKLSDCELQLEYLFIRFRNLCFKQDNVLHHSSTDLAEQSIQDSLSFNQR